jgi:eukaryotic-like serine/threonine-protein kinase
VIGIGSTLNQRFTLEKELGRGGMGAVYRATDQVLGRTVAIKILKDLGGDADEVGKRIRLEAQILARLAHEHIVRLYDFGQSESTYFLVMEEVDGTSFARRWRNLPLLERLRVAAEVAEALDYAHHQGVIHRDVKPANVLLTARDAARLSDFGLSMMAESGDETGVVRGTPHYMSPEQGQGRRLDYRTDLYSLGVMLYECATGSVPFLGQSMTVIAQHIGVEPRPPRFKNPDVATDLETLILSLLAKDPAARPVSGQVVARTLREQVERERTGATTVLLAPPATAAAEIAPAAPSEGPVSGPDVPTITRGLTDTPSGPVLPPPAVAPAPAPAPGAFPAPVSVPIASPLARAMFDDVLAEPLLLSPDERYLIGHYLGFLLGGARRQGLFLRRPNDPRNADRGLLLLAMAWLTTAGASDANIARAAELLAKGPDVRPALNPVVVLKYLAGRSTPARRKKFRAVRRQLLDACPYAQKHMVDPNGVLNPGLMPQMLDDLRKVAPERDEVDDHLVERWNRVNEVWRSNADFRYAVLRYATRSAHRDPASVELWPEVVYPLMERARWQREFRPGHEALWDYVSARVFRVPDAGVRLDRMIVTAVPEQVADELDEAIASFVDDPRLDDDDAPAAAAESGDDRLAAQVGDGVSLHDLAADVGPKKGLVRLAPPDPFRFTQGEIRDLWREAEAAVSQARVKPGGSGGPGHRSVPVGPYRLAVIPTLRGRTSGLVVLQGMRNKQVEMLTPSVRAGGSSSRLVVAVWIYQDASAALVYLDFKWSEKYILWYAPNAQQFNYDHPADLNHMLFNLGLEAPDQLDRVLTRKFQPRGG